MAGLIGAFAVLIARILVFGLIAPVLPALREVFHATYLQAGLGMSLAFAGSMTANIFGGPAVDRWGEKALLNFGNILGIAGPFLVAFSRSLAEVYMGMFLIGLSGISFVAGLALISESGRGSRVSMLNAAHGTMAIVLAIDPWVAGILLDKGYSFYQLFQFGAWFSVVVGVLFLFCHVDRHQRPAGPGAILVYKKLLSNRAFLVILAGVFMYIGLETGITTWIPLFLVNHDGFSKGIAGSGLMMFWFLMAGGRFVIPRVTRMASGRLVRVLLTFAALLIGLVLVGAPPWVDLLALGMSGLMMSVSFPLFQASTGQMFPKNVGTAFGLLSVTVGLAGTIFPSLMGWISDMFPNAAGLRWALLVPMLMAVSTAFFAVFMLKGLKMDEVSAGLNRHRV